MDLGMGILWGGLLGAPIAGFAIRALWQGERRTVLITAVATIGVIVLAVFTGLRFTSPLLNLSALVLGYTAYALLVTDGWGISHKRFILRALATTATSLPILFGYFLATIGFLGLLFMFTDFTKDARHAETLEPGIGCEVRLHSGGPSWGTINVSIHRELTPFLRWERFHQALPEEDAPPYAALCQSAYQIWRTP